MHQHASGLERQRLVDTDDQVDVSANYDTSGRLVAPPNITAASSLSEEIMRAFINQIMAPSVEPGHRLVDREWSGGVEDLTTSRVEAIRDRLIRLWAEHVFRRGQ